MLNFLRKIFGGKKDRRACYMNKNGSFGMGLKVAERISVEHFKTRKYNLIQRKDISHG